MEEFIQSRLKEYDINTKDCEVFKGVDNLIYIELENNKDIEEIINIEIREQQIGELLDEKVKQNYENWTNFNKFVKKSHRNRDAIINKCLSLTEMLKYLNLDSKLIEIKKESKKID